MVQNFGYGANFCRRTCRGNRVCEIRVDIASDPISPDSITLNKTVLTFNNTNDTERLIATVFPRELSAEKLIWQSSNEAVATVDTTGVVTPVANGNAAIMALTAIGHTVICSVEVQVPIEPNNQNADRATTRLNNQSAAPAPARRDNPNAAPASARPDNRNTVPPAPTTARLNDLLHQITNSDDQATDELRKVLGNSLRVEGAPNISNVQQLITDASNGSRYTVTRVNTDTDGTISYQWYINSFYSNTGGTVLTGATEASFSISATLAVGTYYYFCELNATGGASSVRTNVATVIVLANLPILSTNAVTNVSPTTDTLVGYIFNAGTPAYSERGLVYATFQYPTIYKWFRVRKPDISASQSPV